MLSRSLGSSGLSVSTLGFSAAHRQRPIDSKAIVKRTSALFSLFLWAAATPVVAQPSGNHVILVIIDGARYSETLGDSAARFVPHMRQLSMEGTVIDTFLNDGVTVTNRGVPAIWSGSWSAPVPFGNTQYMLVPSVWEYYRKAAGADTTQAMYIMKWLSTPWLMSYHPEYGPSYWPWYMLQGSSDSDVWQNARDKLQTYHPALCVVYFADVDHEGHSGVWDNYVRAVTIADSLVGEAWALVQADSVLRDRTTLIVTNDHGRHLDGVGTGFVGHGDDCWGCRHIMLLAVGNAVKPGYRSAQRRTIPDIVPTIGSVLGFPTPYVSGSSMDEIFAPAMSVAAGRDIPQGYRLAQNFPNPFNPSTTIAVQLPERQRVTLQIFDVLGRCVALLHDGELGAGYHRFEWNATGYSSGVYLCTMRAAMRTQTRTMVLVR